MIDLDNFPTFSEDHFHVWISEVTPIQEYKGYQIKRDDLFNLAGVSGGKVRQAAKLVYDNLNYIKDECNGGILTAAGVPSPQSCITAAIAKYFGLKCIVTIPHYPDHIRDSYRINTSLAQKFGAKIYGVGNPNTSGPETDAKKLVMETGYFQIKFGMNGTSVMETVAQQVKNIPDDVETIVGISGSGLSMLGVAMGCKIFNKNVKTIYSVALSGYVNKNKMIYYDNSEYQFDGDFSIVQSEYSYQYKLKLNEDIPFDLTYEAKAWDWMIKHIEPSKKVLFWDVGIKEYDLNYIEPIKWHKSEYEKSLDLERELRKQQKMNHDFF